MHEILLSVSHQSLGKILEQLCESPEVKASPELTERLRQAIFFHQQVSVEFQELLQAYQDLREERSRLTRELDERVCNRISPSQFSQYEKMRDAGSRPPDVYLAAKNDGLDEIEAIKVLRQVFHFSLREAESAIAEAEREFQHTK